MLRHEDGTRAFLLGVTAFPILPYWYMGGEWKAKIEPFVAACLAAVGQGCVFRALGMAHGGVSVGFGGWTVDYPGSGQAPAIKVRMPEQAYLDALSSLAAWLKTKGGRLKLSLCADCVDRGDGSGGTMPRPLDRMRLSRKVGEALAPHTNILLDAGNEWSKNGFNPDHDFLQTGGVLSSRGSGQGDEWPPWLRPLHYWDFHPNRTDREDLAGRVYLDAHRRQCKAVYDIYTGQSGQGEPALKIPGSLDEPIGIDEAKDPGRTTADPQACGEFAAGTKLFGAALVVGHIRSGIRDLHPPGPIATACLRAMREYADLVPEELTYPNGRYTRGGLADCPLQHNDARALRTFAIVRADHLALAMAMDVAPQWGAYGANSYRIVRQAGPRGQIVELT